MSASQINWELLKFKYEVLGMSLKDLASENQLSEAVINYNSQDWVRLPLAELESLDLKSLKTLDDVLTKLGDRTANQTKVFSILKQKFLGPKYVELETVLLHKAIEIAQQVTPDDSKGALTLKTLSLMLSDLLAQNPDLISNENATQPDGKWEITFVESKSDS